MIRICKEHDLYPPFELGVLRIEHTDRKLYGLQQTATMYPQITGSQNTADEGHFKIFCTIHCRFVSLQIQNYGTV